MKMIVATRLLRLCLAMGAICLWAGAGVARADLTLWYNGDFDGNSALYNEVNTFSGSTGLVYDDFIIPVGQTWTIDGVFSNDQMSGFGLPALSAYWEIRSGVMNMVGGTLLASGTDLATQPATGTVAVSGLSVTLSAGTYWLTVAPVAQSATDLSFISTTSGANAIGMPPGNDGMSFVAGPVYAYDFEPASDYVSNPNGGPPDFSMGVMGVVQSVPEPSTGVIGLIGALALSGRAWLCRRRRAA